MQKFMLQGYNIAFKGFPFFACCVCYYYIETELTTTEYGSLH